MLGNQTPRVLGRVAHVAAVHHHDSLSDHLPGQYIQQNIYDQRSIPVDQRQLHVGVNPEVMPEANAMVHAAKEQVYQIQSQAQTEVNQNPDAIASYGASC